MSSVGWRRRRSWWFGELDQISCPGLEQPRVFMAQGPAVSVVQAEPWLLHPAQPFPWCSAQCSPSGALVQLGGVLALHVRHVALCGLLPMKNEPLLGIPITLLLLCSKHDRAHHTLLSQLSRCQPREYKLQIGGSRSLISREHLFTLRIETIQVSELELADILNITGNNPLYIVLLRVDSSRLGLD